MKKLAAILCLSALTTGAFAQGLVNFINTSTTLSSATVNGTSAATSGNPGSYYYGLLLAAAGTTDPKAFTFSGMYATNLSAAGRFNGGINQVVPTTPGWAAGASMSYEVAIWSSSLGHDWQAGWLQGNFPGAPAGSVFGLSSIATGISGGAGAPASPAYNLFGGATGLSTGFNANPIGGTPPVPEPTSMALAGLGAAALLIFRRRK
jgi:hypothetical protein